MNLRNENPVKPGPLQLSQRQLEVIQALQSRETVKGGGILGHGAEQKCTTGTLAWLSKCRAVLVRYDKKVANYLGVLQLACALLWFRRQWRLAILR